MGEDQTLNAPNARHVANAPIARGATANLDWNWGRATASVKSQKRDNIIAQIQQEHVPQQEPARPVSVRNSADDATHAKCKQQ